MPAATRPALLSLDQAANHLGVSARTVRRYIAAGRIDAHRLGPRLIRVRADQLDRLLRDVPNAAA